MTDERPLPAVSVLMPVRDAAATLPTAIRSLGRQALEDFEVVAVDDGSTDASGAILDAWAARDPRVRVLHEPARGLPAALNQGLDACRAPLVARMDADDAMLPDRLAAQVAALVADPSLDVAGCGVRSFPRSRVGEGFRRYERWLGRLRSPEDHAREVFVESPIAHPSVLARRSVLVDAGGYRDLDWPEDYDLWLRLLEDGRRFAKVSAVLHLWRERPDRATRTDARYSKAAFTRCRAHFLARRLRREQALQPTDPPVRVVLWGAGPTGKGLAKALRHEGIEPVAFVDIDAKKIGRRPAGIPVVGVDALESLRAEGPTRVLVSVARRGARDVIRPQLESRGWIEGEDYLAVAAGWIG